MWLAHYGYHLLTSCRAAIPAAQRFVAQFGWDLLGSPRVERRLLPAGAGLVAEAGDRLPRPRPPPVALQRLPDRAGMVAAAGPGVRAVGAADRRPLRCGRLDRPPADADAGDDVLIPVGPGEPAVFTPGTLPTPRRTRPAPAGPTPWRSPCSWRPSRPRPAATAAPCRAWSRRADCEVAVFTEPTPFVAGPVDVSVLLLDPTTGEPIPGARVTVAVAPEGRPDLAAEHPATAEAAANKLLYAAVFELRYSGRCDVTVKVDGSVTPPEVRFTLDVARPSRPGRASGRGSSGPCR